MAEFTRWQFIREARNSRWYWFVGIGWTLLSAYSTLSSYFPVLTTYVHVWHWYVYVIGFLLIAFAAIFEGAYKQGRILWQLTNQKEIDKKMQICSRVIGELPQYLHDIRLDSLSAYQGTTLIEDDNAIFLNLSIVSDYKTGLMDMTVVVYVGDEKHECLPLADLSDWIARTEIDHAVIPYKRFDDRNLEELSLWKDVQHTGLDPGIVKRGWVGIRFPGLTWNSLHKVSKLRIQLRKTQSRHHYKFTFSSWAEPKEKIFDKAFLAS